MSGIVALPLLDAVIDSPAPASCRDLDLVRINAATAVDLNRQWHRTLPLYGTGSCLFASVAYAALLGNRYYAVAIWTNPVARNLPQREWLELRRLAVGPDAPRYTASWMLGAMARDIRRTMPIVCRLVSYQDTTEHTGTIYRAANWHEAARWAGGTWNRPGSRNASGTPRTRPDSNGATGPKVRWEYELRAP